LLLQPLLRYFAFRFVTFAFAFFNNYCIEKLYFPQDVEEKIISLIRLVLLYF